MKVEEVLQQELDTLKADIINRHELARQVVSGRTRDSFEVVVDSRGGQLLGASYVGVLERGRGRGDVPKGFYHIIKRWAEAKNITFKSEADKNRFAYFVAKKIREEGTALYRSQQPEDIFTTAISDFEDRLTERLSVYYLSEIKNTIFSLN